MTADEARKIKKVDERDVATWLNQIMFEIDLKIDHKAMQGKNQVYLQECELDELSNLFEPLDYEEYLETIAKRLKALGFKLMILTSEDCMRYTEADNNTNYEHTETLVIEW